MEKHFMQGTLRTGDRVTYEGYVPPEPFLVRSHETIVEQGAPHVGLLCAGFQVDGKGVEVGDRVRVTILLERVGCTG